MKAPLLTLLRALPARGTLIAVAGLMAGIYAVDVWLANLERREVGAEARGLYAQGERQLAAGRASEAVTAFQRARYLVRTDRVYELALARAQLANRRTEDARNTLADALARDSNDGRANLLMARTMAAAGDGPSAISYYHRAIYGGWPDANAAPAERMKTRLELADLLAKTARKPELLSETLLIANSSGPSMQVAGLYLEADSANRAAAVYRSILHSDPANAAAHTGLGNAELALGNFQAAHAAFRRAAALTPGDAPANARVELAKQLEDLDPTSRRLGSAEKFRRSRQVLSLTRDAIAACAQGRELPSRLQTLLAEAEKLGAEKTSGSPTNELAEARLSLAENIWKARAEACTAAPPPENALSILQNKLEQ